MKSICIDIEQGNLEQLKEVTDILEGMGHDNAREWNDKRIKAGFYDRIVAFNIAGKKEWEAHNHKRRIYDDIKPYTYEQFIELHKPKE